MPSNSNLCTSSGPAALALANAFCSCTKRFLAVVKSLTAVNTCSRRPLSSTLTLLPLSPFDLDFIFWLSLMNVLFPDSWYMYARFCRRR